MNMFRANLCLYVLCFIWLTERQIEPDDELAGRRISEIPKRDGMQITMIHRNGKVIIPKGYTKLKSGDLMVINRVE